MFFSKQSQAKVVVTTVAGFLASQLTSLLPVNLQRLLRLSSDKGLWGGTGFVYPFWFFWLLGEWVVQLPKELLLYRQWKEINPTVYVLAMVFHQLFLGVVHYNLLSWSLFHPWKPCGDWSTWPNEIRMKVRCTCFLHINLDMFCPVPYHVVLGVVAMVLVTQEKLTKCTDLKLAISCLPWTEEWINW